MSKYTFRLATRADTIPIRRFMNTHWGSLHPLINQKELFAYYFHGKDGSLRFALALEDNKISALAGYIPASALEGADIWVSIWLADKAAQGSGLELMAALPTLTNARNIACNNIRPNTRPFYHMLGYATGRVGHFYRLADKDIYQLAQIKYKKILPPQGDGVLMPLANKEALLSSGFEPPKAHNPYKDMAYLAHRYFDFPLYKYQVYLAHSQAGAQPSGLLVLRLDDSAAEPVLRVVDFIGSDELLASLGNAIDELLVASAAEYVDFYCLGIAKEALTSAGFCERYENDANIIPNYLNPVLIENTDYYYFTSSPENFVLCRADGDQDRPNLKA